MAVRDRPAGFRGGIARWVTPDDVRQVRAEVAALSSPTDLLGWIAPRRGLGRLHYQVRLGVRFHAPLSDTDRDEVVRTAILSLASTRRHNAIYEHAKERRLDIPAAVGTDRSGRSLARCPSCNAPQSAGDLYCDERECRTAETEELSAVIGRTPHA